MTAERPPHPGFVDPALVPICGELAELGATFEQDLAGLVAADFVPWFDVDVFTGEWLVFPIVSRLSPQPPGFDLERNRRLCPQSHTLLAAQPRILLAGFSRLMPGTVVHPHSDHPGADVLRFHLGLRPVEGSELAFGDSAAVLRRREVVLFDHSMIHSARNLGATPRDLLLVDVRLTADEVERVTRARGGVHLG